MQNMPRHQVQVSGWGGRMGLIKIVIGLHGSLSLVEGLELGGIHGLGVWLSTGLFILVGCMQRPA